MKKVYVKEWASGLFWVRFGNEKEFTYMKSYEFFVTLANICKSQYKWENTKFSIIGDETKLGEFTILSNATPEFIEKCYLTNRKTKQGQDSVFCERADTFLRSMTKSGETPLLIRLK